MADKFYVYVIFRSNGVPCYVGKGTGGRWRDHVRNAKNPHLRNIYRQADSDLPIVIVRERLTEAEALNTEIALIAAIGRKRHGGPLVNLTDGGEGTSGNIVGEEGRLRMRAAALGRELTPEWKAAIGAAHRGKKRSPQARENLLKAAQTRRPKPPLSAEHRANLSIAMTGRIVPPEVGAKIAASKRGKKRAPFSAEHRAKTSATMKAVRARYGDSWGRKAK